MNSIAKFLNLSNDSQKPIVKQINSETLGDYKRSLIEYESSEGDLITAYLFKPLKSSQSSCPGVLVHHQHNGEQFLGKSEVAGIKGDPLQAFGPALAKRGVIVLAPDQICFEDRRRNKKGSEPGKDDEDFLQQFNEMSYRLVKGDTLMRKVLDDAFKGISVLCNHNSVDKNKIGVLGHSLGGNTTLFHAAVDERVKFACASGALCSFENKMENETSLEMGLIIPDFLEHFKMADLIKAILPREVMVVSAEKDKYSKDAHTVLKEFETVKHLRTPDGHALDEGRFTAMIDWVTSH